MNNDQLLYILEDYELNNEQKIRLLTDLIKKEAV